MIIHEATLQQETTNAVVGLVGIAKRGLSREEVIGLALLSLLAITDERQVACLVLWDYDGTIEIDHHATVAPVLGCLALNGDVAEPLIDNNRWPDVFHDEPCILVIQADARLRSHGLTASDVIVDGRIKHKFVYGNGINVAFVLAIAVHGALFGVIIGRHELPNRTIVGGFVDGTTVGLHLLARAAT